MLLSHFAICKTKMLLILSGTAFGLRMIAEHSLTRSSAMGSCVTNCLSGWETLV